MTDELRIRIDGEIPLGAETSSVRARFTRDAAEDVQGQGYGVRGLAPTDEDTEGQGYRSWLKPGENGDAEGQGMGYRGLKPAEDAEGHGGRFSGFLPVEDEDAMANALRSHLLEIERDEEGELVGRYIPAKDDDTEGQGVRPPPDLVNPGLPGVEDDDEVEGHGGMTGNPRAPVD